MAANNPATHTGHKAGIILNFKRAKLEWERIVLDHDREREHNQP